MRIKSICGMLDGWMDKTSRQGRNRNRTKPNETGGSYNCVLCKYVQVFGRKFSIYFLDVINT